MKIFRARVAARPGRKSSPCVNSLMRYAILGAVALSLAPSSALAGFQLPSAQTQEDQSGDGAERPAKVNTHAFRELLSRVKRLKDEGALDLSGTLAVNIEADRNVDGTIENVTITSAPLRNAELRGLAEDFARALSESRVLAFLDGVRHLQTAFSLDAASVVANLTGEVESETRAAEMARGYNALLAAARAVKRGTPVAAVYNNMTVSANGKQLAFKLEMSREAAGNLLLKQISPN